MSPKSNEELIECPACGDMINYGCKCEDYFYFDDDEYRRQEWDERWIDKDTLEGGAP